MFGAWGKATADGKVVQLRALDWVYYLIFRILMDLIVNIPLSLFIIQVTKNMVIPG
jgi:hypothetical protein